MSTLLQSPVIIKNAAQSKGVDNISFEDDNMYPIACTLLNTVAKMWSRMSADDRVVIISTLYEVKIIPTIGGLQKPCNSYLPSANLFPDLPIVLRSVIKICKESLLIELGVKKHVDLQLIFDRIDTELKWDHIQLVKYLTSVSDTLTDAEYNKLKSASIFPAQEMQMDQNTSNPGDISSKRKIYRANELYFPSEKITNLGLPVLKWNKHGLFNFPSSPEGIFLAKLGMQICPNILELVTIASKQPINTKISSDINFSIDSDASLRTKALEYLLENFYKEYFGEYSETIKRNIINFLPVYSVSNKLDVTGDVSKSPSSSFTPGLEHPSRCYSDPSSILLKFPVLDKRWRRSDDKLGVMAKPSIKTLLERISGYSFDSFSEAISVFEYLLSRMDDFKNSDWEDWKKTQFIPIFDKKNSYITKKLCPNDCYFETSSEDILYQSPYYKFKNIFLETINFGEKASIFFKYCGVRDEPSPIDVADRLLSNPGAVLLAFNDSYEDYVNLLKNLSEMQLELKKNPQIWKSMQESKWLVAIQRKKNPNSEFTTEFSEIESEYRGQLNETVEFTLSKPNEIVINDDMFLERQFCPKTSPNAFLLKRFYISLGSKVLSESVRIYNKPLGTPKTSKISTELERIIKNRAHLILCDYSVNSLGDMKKINPEILGNSFENPKKYLLDIELLRQRLIVCQVQEIEIYREFTLTGEVFKDSASACGMIWSNKDSEFKNNGVKSECGKEFSEFAKTTISELSNLNNAHNGGLSISKDEWYFIFVIRPSGSCENSLQELDPKESSGYWNQIDLAMTHY
ncbi:hypothetical protein AYI68_g7102 [Smittium mucronatum]|uniref:Uncharacterized protein n=1 Tax=Smittium mucronatum TaxID=133383 RepID=A0A1R0GPN1_9FUNG|nr:hypothetical protein AYI68_g7102 [Smittium mucronatum]